MSKLCKRVRLIHELRERRRAEELSDCNHYGANVDKSLRSDLIFIFLSLNCHSLSDNSLHSCKTDSELILKQLAYGTDSSVAEMVYIVNIADSLGQAVDIVNGCEYIVNDDVLGNKVVAALSHFGKQGFSVIKEELAPHLVVNFCNSR